MQHMTKLTFNLNSNIFKQIVRPRKPRNDYQPRRSFLPLNSKSSIMSPSAADRPLRRAERSSLRDYQSNFPPYRTIIQSDHARRVHLVLWKKRGKQLVGQLIGQSALYPATETIKETRIVIHILVTAGTSSRCCGALCETFAN